MNVQRDLIYRQRRQVHEGADLRETITDYMRESIAAEVDTHCGSEIREEDWDLQGLFNTLDQLFDLSLSAKPADLKNKSRDELAEMLTEIGERRYEEKEQELVAGGADPREVERFVTLQIIDQKWIEHLQRDEALHLA